VKDDRKRTREQTMKTKITHDEPAPLHVESRAGAGPVRPLDAASRSGSGKAGKIIGIVALALVAAVGVVAIAGGGALLWVDRAKTDSQGFYRSVPHQFETGGRALVTNLDGGVGSFMLDLGHLDEIQLISRSNDPAKELFVGIASEQDVAAYLSGVQIDEVSDVELDPFQASYTPRPGDALPTPPGDVSIWAASASGPGSQTLVWPAEEGDWSVVVMNADGSPSVDADIAAAATAPFVFRVGLGLLLGGAVILLAALATATYVQRASRRGRGRTWATPAA
jgi:hypothetical protein